MRTAPTPDARIAHGSSSGLAAYELGAMVRCADGPCGELGRLVIDPLTRSLTHLVVEPHHHHALGRLVPVALATDAGDHIELGCSLRRIRELEYVEETELLPADPWLSAGFPQDGGGRARHGGSRSPRLAAARGGRTPGRARSTAKATCGAPKSRSTGSITSTAQACTCR